MSGLSLCIQRVISVFRSISRMLFGITFTLKQPKKAMHPAAINTSPTTLTNELFSFNAISDHLDFSPPRPPSKVSALSKFGIFF